MQFLSQQSSVLLSCLEGVTIVALCALATPEKSPHIPSALLETAVILHGLWNLILIYSSECNKNFIAFSDSIVFIPVWGISPQFQTARRGCSMQKGNFDEHYISSHGYHFLCINLKYYYMLVTFQSEFSMFNYVDWVEFPKSLKSMNIAQFK